MGLMSGVSLAAEKDVNALIMDNSQKILLTGADVKNGKLGLLATSFQATATNYQTKA